MESFEDKIKKLESLVVELENGDVNLDKAIDKYTEAMKLAKECSTTLTDYSDKVNKILFFFCRILQGFITALLTHLGIKLFSVTTDVFSTSTVENFSFFGGTALSGAALLFTALCFLYSLKNYKQN